jgi:hypothetical protein
MPRGGGRCCFNRPQDWRDPGFALEAHRPASRNDRSSRNAFGWRIRSAEDAQQPSHDSDQHVSGRSLQATPALGLRTRSTDFRNFERDSSQFKKSVQPGIGAGVGRDRFATGIVALVSAHACDALARDWRVAKDCAISARALRLRDHARHVHPRRSRRAEAGSRARCGSFGPLWTQLRSRGNFGRICKLMRVRLLAGKFGEPGRTRTCNPLIKSQLLYH